MTILASDICTLARTYLNDTSIQLFDNATLLPYLQTANNELSDKLITNGLSNQKVVNSVQIIIAVGTKILSPLPDDLIVPIKLWERTNPSTDDFWPMIKKEWEPNIQPGNTLTYWTWRNQEILFVGALTSREIKLAYIRTLSSFTADGSPSEVTGATNYLAYRTASLAAKWIGENPDLALELSTEAMSYLNDLLMIGVRINQGNPARRKGFRSKAANRRLL